jgi:hypothetical protein
MRGMSPFDKKSRIQVISLPKITDELDRIRVALTRGTTINNRKVDKGPFLNAILVWLLDQPDEIQAEIYTYGRQRVDQMLTKGDTRGDWRKPRSPRKSNPGTAGDPVDLTLPTLPAKGKMNSEEPPKAPPRKRQG